ncbi:hypothetical protein [Streptomyces sp. NPDC051994]|uniref:hypothetical protein n=1 Tax=unclassified Streptomyces TaxID=2593676 RepID=UPI00342DD3ED
MATVTMLINDELLQVADMTQMLALLGAREVGREPDERPGSTLLTLDIPDAPDGATSIEPVLRCAADGTVSVLSMGWH